MRVIGGAGKAAGGADAGSAHGLYLGFEWELGGFRIVADADPLPISAGVHPLTENISLAPSEVIWIPAVYQGTRPRAVASLCW